MNESYQNNGESSYRNEFNYDYLKSGKFTDNRIYFIPTLVLDIYF